METGLLSIPIRPKTPDDEQRLARALEQLTVEDPTIRVQIDRESREVVLGGTGELHLEIIIDRLKREFNVEASVGSPQVAYREALTRPAEGEVKYAMHMGGRGQYATDLRARTFGRGAFKTRFYRYQPRRVAGGEDEARESMVGAPLKPRPNPRVSSVALPEPDDIPDDDQDDGLLSV